MKKIKNLSGAILESIVYSISGGIFVLIIFLIEECYERSQDVPGFPPNINQSIGLLWILLGLFFSSLLCSLLFRKATKFLFLKWSFLLIFSTVTPVLMQMIFLINNSNIIDNLQMYSIEDIYGTAGISLFTKLFTALIPFVFLFAGCQKLLENRKKRNIFS